MSSWLTPCCIQGCCFGILRAAAECVLPHRMTLRYSTTLSRTLSCNYTALTR
jgi:hypothetical protein